MPFQIIRNDITKVQVDAIVNAANNSLLGGGGVDGAIHQAAGPELLEECRLIGGCPTGEVRLTKAYHLPAKHVIHTVGPVWRGGGHGEEALLRSCYRKSLELAREKGLESIAFPLISAGVYGYPQDQAMAVAVSTIGEFLLNHDMLVYLVVFNRNSVLLSEKLFQSITQFIDDHYVEEHGEDLRARKARLHLEETDEIGHICDVGEICQKMSFPMASAICTSAKLEDELDELEETFSERLLRLIDESGMSDSEAYKKANVDRKLFSKIRSDRYYQPSKPTAIAFAIALRLDLKGTEELLQTAGFALSYSNKFDVIIRYFIKQNNYDIFEINEAMFAFQQNLLGI